MLIINVNKNYIIFRKRECALHGTSSPVRTLPLGHCRINLFNPYLLVNNNLLRFAFRTTKNVKNNRFRNFSPGGAAILDSSTKDTLQNGQNRTNITTNVTIAWIRHQSHACTPT